MPLRATKAMFRCAFCGSKLLKRTSWLTHPHLRGDVYCCENPLCHASFIGMTEPTHILSPSGMAAMDSQLPNLRYINAVKSSWPIKNATESTAEICLPTTWITTIQRRQMRCATTPKPF